MALLTLNLFLFISPALCYWPTQRGESNAGCNAQATLSLTNQMTYESSVALPNKFPLAPLRSNTLIPSPLICPSGRLFLVGSGGVLFTMDGTTLEQLSSFTVPGLSADDISLAYDGKVCTVFVNGVGELNEDLGLVAAIPARTVGVEPVSGVVVTFDSTVFFAVRPIVVGPPICQNGGQTLLPGDATILSSFSQYASTRMFFAILSSGNLVIASLDLTSCSVTLSLSSYSMPQWFTAAISPYASFVVLYLQEQGLIVLDADKLEPLYVVTPALSGYTPAITCQPTLALSSPNGGTTTTLVISTCLTSVSLPATLTPFLFSFSLSASGATPLWFTDLSSILLPTSATTPPTLNGLAIDKAGNIFASGGPHGDQNVFGGMFSFSGKDGSLQGQTQCTPTSTTCGLYGQPSLGLDNTLYTFVKSNGSWEGLVSFSPNAPIPNAALPKKTLVIVLSVLGGLIGVGGVGYLVYKCRGSGGVGGGVGGSVYKELGSAENTGFGGGNYTQPTDSFGAPYNSGGSSTTFLGSGKPFSFKKEYAQPVNFDRELR